VTTIKTFNSRQEAEIVKSLLASWGIDALILADDQGGLQPALSFTRGVDLKVHDDDAKIAVKILDDVERETGA
jgi:hypothetical protein